MNKELLTEETTRVINKETGCYNVLKTFKLGELGQAIVWQIKKNTEDIEYLKKENDALKKTCNVLIKEVEKLKEQQHKQLEINL